MVIERTILSKVAELNGISICDERTVKIELTEAEIEEAYRIREREYLEVDFLEAKGLAKSTGRTRRSGYCIYPSMKFNREKMAEFEGGY